MSVHTCILSRAYTFNINTHTFTHAHALSHKTFRGLSNFSKIKTKILNTISNLPWTHLGLFLFSFVYSHHANFRLDTSYSFVLGFQTLSPVMVSPLLLLPAPPLVNLCLVNSYTPFRLPLRYHFLSWVFPELPISLFCAVDLDSIHSSPCIINNFLLYQIVSSVKVKVLYFLLTILFPPHHTIQCHPNILTSFLIPRTTFSLHLFNWDVVSLRML